MKRILIVFAFLTGTSVLGAQAAPSVHPALMKTTTSIRTLPPYSCTISLTGTISAGFGSVSATCSATESTCSLAQASAATCLSNVLKSIRAQLK